jgi:hypothetical protein
MGQSLIWVFLIITCIGLKNDEVGMSKVIRGGKVISRLLNACMNI